MELEYEIWKFGDEYCKLYANDKSLIDRLLKIVKTEISCFYAKDGIEYGWDILVPNKKVTEVKRIIRTVIKESKKPVKVVKPKKFKKESKLPKKTKTLPPKESLVVVGKVKKVEFDSHTIIGPGDDDYGRKKTVMQQIKEDKKAKKTVVKKLVVKKTKPVKTVKEKIVKTKKPVKKVKVAVKKTVKKPVKNKKIVAETEAIKKRVAKKLQQPRNKRIV